MGEVRAAAPGHVTAETKAPLDSIVLTNQAGLSWALQNFDKGWALGTISLHGKPVEAQASNGMLILHNVITGEQRWIPGVYPLFWRRLCPLPTDCRFPSAALDVVPPEAYGRATYLIEKERTGV
jgi:hypothetical protein